MKTFAVMDRFRNFKLSDGAKSCRLSRLVLLTAGFFAMTASTAKAELFFSFYGGTLFTQDSDVHYRDGASTDIKLNGVDWDAEPFKDAPYYGYKVGYWFERAPTWGISGEFIHGKMIADKNDTVSVSGTRDGVPVSGTEPLGNTFSHLELSHGHNLIMLNVEHRWFLAAQEGESFWRRVQPYAGIGGGVALPHVEVSTPTSYVNDYILSGPAVQGFVGVNVDLVKFVSLFVEYKLTYADINADLPGEGSLKTQSLSHHVAVGFSLSFGGQHSRPHARLDN